MSKYYKAFNTLKGPVTHLKNIVSSAIGKKQKTTGTEVINKVKPNVPKTKLEKTKSKLAIAKQKTKASQAKLDNTIFRINQQKKRLEREKKMGGGMMGRRMGLKLGSLKPGVLKTVKKIIDESKAKKQDKARVKKMGGGMMGRRFGMKEGSKKGKVPTTTKEKSLAKLAPPRDRITFGDVVAGRTKGAKNGKTMS